MSRFMLSAARNGRLWWLAAALVFTALCIARSLFPAFLSGNPGLQDDVRQHGFWMARFRDPELFPNDLIADYYQALAPPAYTFIYWVLSRVIDPLRATWLLPPLLGIGTAIATFALARRLHPSPVAAFLASALHSWYLWQYDDIASATPRAFLPLCVTTIAWALADGRRWLSVVLIALAALLYPAGAALGVALLATQLLVIRNGRPDLSRDWRPWIALGAAVLIAAAAILPTQHAGAAFGPAWSDDDARAMPDFGPQGRTPVFAGDPFAFWIASEHTGLDLRARDPFLRKVPILAEYLLLAALLPVLLLLRRRLPEVRQLSGRAVILLQLLVASLGTYGLVHAVLFQLYLPNRFVKWSVPLVLSIAAGLALGILLEALARRSWGARRRLLPAALALGMSLGLAFYPVRYNSRFRADQHPVITQYLRAQPKDALVAGASSETDSIPAFAARSVLVSREHLHFWRRGYYAELSRRTEDLLKAYYTDSPQEVADFTERYGVDILLVDRRAFVKNGVDDAWIAVPFGGWEPFETLARKELQRTRDYALLDLAARCADVDDGQVAAVPAACLAEYYAPVGSRQTQAPYASNLDD